MLRDVWGERRCPVEGVDSLRRVHWRPKTVSLAFTVSLLLGALGLEYLDWVRFLISLSV